MGARRNYSEHEKKRCAELIRQGLTSSQIAKRLGCSANFVRAIAHKHGLPIAQPKRITQIHKKASKAAPRERGQFGKGTFYPDRSAGNSRKRRESDPEDEG